MSSQTIKIESKEREIITVDLRVANMINLFKDMLEDNACLDEKIPLESISSEILKLVF